MKKLFNLVFVTLLLLMGCNDDEVVRGGFTNGSLQATFEDGVNKSRLAIGEDNVLTWTNGDAFMMFSDEAEGHWALNEASAGQATGTFSGLIPDGDLKGAAFPASANPTRENGTLKMTLMSELEYDANGKCNLPMWASFSSLDASISFKHLAALLKIDFSNIPAGYNKMVVKADKPLSGEFAADLTMDNPTLVPNISQTDGERGVTISFVPFEETKETNKSLFYIPLPVGEYEFIKVFISGEGKDDVLLAAWENRTIERTKVYLASLTYKEVEAEKPVEINNVLIGLQEIPVVQVAVVGTVDATTAGAGEIEIPVVEEKATNVTLAFENIPATSENAPLKIKEGESTSVPTSNNELTISIPAEENQETHLDLQLPNTTVNVTNGTYATITATTASNTLVIGKGVSVVDLIIQAGNVVLEGKITGSIKRSGDNQDEETIITVEPDAEVSDEVLANLGEKIIVKYRNAILLEDAQLYLQQTLYHVVSQKMGNQGMGAEQGMMIAREALADDMCWSINTWYKTHANWSVNSNATNQYNNRFWNFYYAMIYEANYILEMLDKLNPESLSQAELNVYNQVKGEVLCLRASHHFHLVQLYADRYKAGVNNSQEGIQYRISTNVSDWTLANVEEVYNSILQDLDEACGLLKDVNQETPAHYNEKVVWGLKARVALVKGDYTNAAIYADKAITLAENDGNALMTGDQLYHGFATITTATSEAMLADIPDEKTYFYSFYAFMSWNYSSTAIRQGVKCINSDTYATMSETDLRRAWWDPTGEAEVPMASFFQRPYQNRKFKALSNSDSNLTDGDLAFMRLAEMYLLRAEALARSGQDSAAQEVFTKFQQTRDPQYVNKGNSGEELIKEIMNSRRVELWGEGFRFYDLKRLHLPIKRSDNFDIALCGFLEKDADDEGWTFAKPN